MHIKRKSIDILPKPDPSSQLSSAILLSKILEEISNKGPITFAHYMEMALYTPGLGYYAAGNQKFGEKGDFITAPEISPLFSACIANQCTQILNNLNKESGILEVGAGTGKMAYELLIQLEKLNALPNFYWIFDLSADLKARQKALFEKKIPHLCSKIQWLDRFPKKPFEGIILANEVLDAMPVHRFKQEETLKEMYVQNQNGKLDWTLKAASPAITERIKPFHLPYGYTFEINLSLNAWVASISQTLKRGMLVIIDYGYPEQEYYHPQRTQGTLTCYYKHHAHNDPLILPGIQDITAHVNFSALEKACIEHGFQVAGYTNQANFLINCGLLNFISLAKDPIDQLKMSQEIKPLLMPGEMGELFKVMALSKGLNLTLLGFKQ